MAWRGAVPEFPGLPKYASNPGHGTERRILVAASNGSPARHSQRISVGGARLERSCSATERRGAVVDVCRWDCELALGGTPSSADWTSLGQSFDQLSTQL